MEEELGSVKASSLNSEESLSSSLGVAEELASRLAALQQQFLADTLALAAIMEDRLMADRLAARNQLVHFPGEAVMSAVQRSQTEFGSVVNRPPGAPDNPLTERTGHKYLPAVNMEPNKEVNNSLIVQTIWLLCTGSTAPGL